MASAMKSEADEMLARVSAKGYDAYQSEIAVGGLPVFRVRVGRLATREEALAVGEQLQREEGLAVWLTRAPTSEIGRR